jgi:hypothetical protein
VAHSANEEYVQWPTSQKSILLYGYERRMTLKFEHVCEFKVIFKQRLDCESRHQEGSIQEKPRVENLARLSFQVAIHYLKWPSTTLRRKYKQIFDISFDKKNYF